MSTTTRFFVEVKSLADDADHPNGSFEAILSTDALDRDGEIIDARALDLPKSLPIFTDHEAWNVKSLVARAVPSYDDEGRLVLRGFYGSDAYSQEIRQKVADGLIDSMSVGFRNAARQKDDLGRVHIIKGEAIEGSFVGVPANPEALVTAAKSAELADEMAMTEGTKETTTTTEAPAAPAPEFHPEIGAEADALDAQLEALESLDGLSELEALLSEVDPDDEASTDDDTAGQ